MFMGGLFPSKSDQNVTRAVNRNSRGDWYWVGCPKFLLYVDLSHAAPVFGSWSGHLPFAPTPSQPLMSPTLPLGTGRTGEKVKFWSISVFCWKSKMLKTFMPIVIVESLLTR